MNGTNKMKITALNSFIIFVGTISIIVYFSLFDKLTELDQLQQSLSYHQRKLSIVKSRMLDHQVYSRKFKILRDSLDLYTNFMGVKSYQKNVEVLETLAPNMVFFHLKNESLDGATNRVFRGEFVGSLLQAKKNLAAITSSGHLFGPLVLPIKIDIYATPNEQVRLVFDFKIVGFDFDKK
jgi:hypothetical protein